MNLQIRQAVIDDLDVVVPLFDGYRQFYEQPSDLGRARMFLRERFAQNESIILLAIDDRQQGLGFVQLYPLFSSVRTARTYVLNDLFVVQSARRRGVARALLRASADHTRALGAASLSLQTSVRNASAQRLYESLGWTREQQFCEYHLPL